MELQHRCFVQYMLRNGVVPIEKALNYCQNIPGGTVQDMAQLKFLIIVINRKISNQNYKITMTTCEITNQEVFVWLNTKSDDISKLQSSFSSIELEYFHVILQELLNSENNRLTFVVVLNITSTLTAFFSRDSGQKVLNRWFKGGYFTKNADYVYLGPRLILEFTSYLKAHRPDQVCKLCSELVFTGKRCGMCDRLLHSYCLEKYLSNQANCPSCKSPWVEKAGGIVLASTQELQNVQAEDTSDDSMDQTDRNSAEEPIPGTSSGIVEGTRQKSLATRKRKS